MAIFDNILDTIGNTPLVRLHHIEEEYKLDARITSSLVEETKNSKSLNIYQENNLIYVLGWSKDRKLAFIENRGIDGRGGHDLHFTIQDMVEDKNVYYKKMKMVYMENQLLLNK